MQQGNDCYIFYDEPITCPECGSRCEHPDAVAGVAECTGCGIAFNFEIEDDDETTD